MTNDDLQSHPLFKLCTPKQQDFLIAYNRTKEMYSAIAETYGTTGASRVAKQLQDSEVISTLLYLIAGKRLPVREDLVQLVWSTLQTAKRPHERWRGSEILSDLMGWGVQPQPPDTSELRRQKAKQIDTPDRHVPGTTGE